MQILVSDVLLVVVAILFPPGAALMLTGCSGQLCLSILLTILGYIPGHLHAFWLIYRKIQADERYGVNGHHYVGGGEYEPIGEPVQGAYHHPQYQQPAQPQRNELFAGQSNQQQHQQQASQDRKGAPPPYGAV